MDMYQFTEKHTYPHIYTYSYTNIRKLTSVVFPYFPLTLIFVKRRHHYHLLFLPSLSFFVLDWQMTSPHLSFLKKGRTSQIISSCLLSMSQYSDGSTTTTTTTTKKKKGKKTGQRRPCCTSFPTENEVVLPWNLTCGLEQRIFKIRERTIKNYLPIYQYIHSTTCPRWRLQSCLKLRTQKHRLTNLMKIWEREKQRENVKRGRQRKNGKRKGKRKWEEERKEKMGEKKAKRKWDKESKEKKERGKQRKKGKRKAKRKKRRGKERESGNWKAQRK